MSNFQSKIYLVLGSGHIFIIRPLIHERFYTQGRPCVYPISLTKCLKCNKITRLSVALTLPLTLTLTVTLKRSKNANISNKLYFYSLVHRIYPLHCIYSFWPCAAVH